MVSRKRDALPALESRAPETAREDSDGPEQRGNRLSGPQEIPRPAFVCGVVSHKRPLVSSEQPAAWEMMLGLGTYVGQSLALGREKLLPRPCLLRSLEPSSASSVD